MPDGIFLTPVSGLHYVLHIFDQACSILDLDPMDSEVKIATVQEAVAHRIASLISDTAAKVRIPSIPKFLLRGC